MKGLNHLEAMQRRIERREAGNPRRSWKHSISSEQLCDPCTCEVGRLDVFCHYAQLSPEDLMKADIYWGNESPQEDIS